jgi:hypothetical protein
MLKDQLSNYLDPKVQLMYTTLVLPNAVFFCAAKPTKMLRGNCQLNQNGTVFVSRPYQHPIYGLDKVVY